MIRSTVAHVDLAALQANFEAIQRFLVPDGQSASSAPGIIAVLKANAYGHGAAPVALALEAAGASMLACADIEEAIVLRDAGVRVPILVFGALSVSDLDGVFEYSLLPTISTPWAARAVQAAAAKHRTVIDYHLKVDTGMNRLGFRSDNLRRTMPELLAHANLRLDAVFTHFAQADVPESPMLETQRVRFEDALATITELGGRPRLRHACNSAAMLPRFPLLVRRRSPRTSAVRHRATAACVDDLAHARDVVDESGGRRQGTEARGGCRLRMEVRGE